MPDLPTAEARRERNAEIRTLLEAALEKLKEDPRWSDGPS
jgi:hypothetical protein